LAIFSYLFLICFFEGEKKRKKKEKEKLAKFGDFPATCLASQGGLNVTRGNRLFFFPFL
jgi:hypothetical protein